MLLEKTLESPLDFKKVKSVNPKGNQPWILIGKTDAEAEGPILWPLDAKGWLIGKVPWCLERLKAAGEGVTEVEFAQTLGNSEGQGSLACCSSWSCRKTGLRMEQQYNFLKSHV